MANTAEHKRGKVFQNGLSKIYDRKALKNLMGYGLLK